MLYPYFLLGVSRKRVNTTATASEKSAAGPKEPLRSWLGDAKTSPPTHGQLLLLEGENQGETPVLVISSSLQKPLATLCILISAQPHFFSPKIEQFTCLSELCCKLNWGKVFQTK